MRIRRLLLLFAASLAGACRPAPPPAPPLSAVLVTIDTMRADAWTEAPALRDFLGGAVHFERARTPIVLTLPAHLTLLTGLDPRHHGVHDNAATPLGKERGFSLLQEEFAQAGHLTAAFASCAVVGPETGIGQGFQVFECPPFGTPGSGETGDIPAEARLEAVLAWLASRPKERPFFLWVHFFDPHDPYRPFAGDSRRPGTRAGDGDAALYAGEVRRADAALERLLRALPRDAAIVIASDHGESLGEHGEPTHGNLCHASTADVFLAARGPGVEAGGRDRRLRSLADVAPTFRAWCGLPAQPGDGRPLTGEGHAGVVTESLLAWRTHGWAQVFSATDGRYSLVETGPRLEWFDRSRDPGEREILDPRGFPEFERLDAELLQWRAGAAAPAEESLSDSASPYGAARRPLSAYLPRSENRRLVDPATRFAFSAALSAAQAQMQEGLLPQAVAALERLAAEDARSPLAFYLLAQARGRLAAAGHDLDGHRAAAAAAREAIMRGYAVAPVLHQMLADAIATGDPAEFRAALGVAVTARIVPDLRCLRLAAEGAKAAADAESRDRCRALLERARPHLRAPLEARELEEIAASLR